MKLSELVLYQHIGARLKQRRKELGWSQTKLATAVGMLRTSITNIEAGRQRLPLHLLYQICGLLDLEVRDVLPDVAEVVQSDVSMTINALSDEVPPKTAEFVRQLLDEK